MFEETTEANRKNTQSECLMSAGPASSIEHEGDEKHHRSKRGNCDRKIGPPGQEVRYKILWLTQPVLLVYRTAYAERSRADQSDDTGDSGSQQPSRGRRPLHRLNFPLDGHSLSLAENLCKTATRRCQEQRFRLTSRAGHPTNG